MQFEYVLYRSGQSVPPMYTELLPGGQILALFITSLTDGMAGTYYCSASYANTEPLDASVDIQTYGKYSNALKYFTHTITKKNTKDQRRR